MATNHNHNSNRCECADPGCPVCAGQCNGNGNGAIRLYRIDMDDVTGTVLCEECRNDAMKYSIFTDTIDTIDTIDDIQGQ